MAARRAARRTQGSAAGDTSCVTLRPDLYPVKARAPLTIEPQVVIGRFDIQQAPFVVPPPSPVFVQHDRFLELGETLPLGHTVGNRGPEVLEKLAHAGDVLLAPYVP